MSYVGASGSALSSAMRDAMAAAVLKTANRIEATAKKYAPVRKVFAEKGAARMEKRTFVDEGLPEGLRKKGSKAPKPVVRSVMVRSHRANRMSTSQFSRKDFSKIDEKNVATQAFDYTKNSMGHTVRTLKPGIIIQEKQYGNEKGQGMVAEARTQKTYFKMSDEAYNKLNTRGRYELGRGQQSYQESVDLGENYLAPARSITERYVPGKPGGYPRGAKLNANGTVTFKRHTDRLTVIRVRNETSIRNIVKTASQAKKRVPIPAYTGKELYRSKASAKYPEGIVRVKDTGRKASPHQIKVRQDYVTKVRAIKQQNEGVDDTFGGLNSRSFAKAMTPYSGKSGSFSGSQFGPHFQLQLGGHLRDSIKSDEQGGLKIRIGTDVYYAIYQEFGTTHNRPQPFLRPALYENRDFLAKAAKDKASRALKGAAGG